MSGDPKLFRPATCAPECLLQEHHVVVMTPQTFLNALDSGYVHVDDLALLVSRGRPGGRVGFCQPVQCSAAFNQQQAGSFRPERRTAPVKLGQ